VSIDLENQRATVSGSVDSSTLIKKLAKSGKHAELLSSHKSNSQAQQKPNQNQKHQPKQQQHQKQPPSNAAKDANKNNNNNKGQHQGGSKQGLIPGLNAFKAQHKNLPSFSSDEEDFYEDDNDYDEDDDEERRLISEKMNQINMLRQANNAAAAAAAAAAAKNAGSKKGVNPNQAKGPNGPDQRAKMAHAANLAGANPGMMGMNGMVPPSMMGGYPSPSMMLNMRGGVPMNNNMMMMHDHQRYMQPQMMYHRSPQISPYTQYYPAPYYSTQPAAAAESTDYSHLFSDENANSCVVM